MFAPKKGIGWLVLLAFMIPILPWLLLGWFLEDWQLRIMTDPGIVAAHRGWVALLGVVLLAADSFLPVPSTILMSVEGYALGSFAGGLAASLGLFLSGLIAYLVCRSAGANLALRLAGKKGLARVSGAMERAGPLVIILTRSVPILQEASSCLAGLTRMSIGVYCLSLALGCVPAGFVYAAIGASGVANKTVAISLSLLVPVLLWSLIFLALWKRRGLQSKASPVDSTIYIGRNTRVIIERPLGSAHPQYGYTYPVNYGHLPGTLSGDGEELDAYVLGVSKPLSEFEGTCIAVIRRKRESDDKLVVVPMGMSFSEQEICRAVEFQESYFESEILLGPVGARGGS